MRHANNDESAFCNYCPCETCRGGADYLNHARTVEGWKICDVCYDYECCLDAGAGHPCEDDCDHRPKLVTEFTKGDV